MKTNFNEIIFSDSQVLDKPIKSYSDKQTLRIKTFNLELIPWTFY